MGEESGNGESKGDFYSDAAQYWEVSTWKSLYNVISSGKSFYSYVAKLFRKKVKENKLASWARTDAMRTSYVLHLL